MRSMVCLYVGYIFRNKHVQLHFSFFNFSKLMDILSIFRVMMEGICSSTCLFLIMFLLFCFHVSSPSLELLRITRSVLSLVNLDHSVFAARGLINLEGKIIKSYLSIFNPPPGWIHKQICK